MRVRLINPIHPRDLKQFIDFPFQLYRDCAQWVPPLLSEARSQVNREHPFYEHSEAACFLTESEGQVLGRIMVMENQNHNRYRRVNSAFFGFFDSVDDLQASQALFEAAIAWARARGLERIIGPRGLIGTDGSGVLVEGFEHRPALTVPYNYSYYDRLISAAGFEKDTDHLSGYLPGDHPLPERLHAIAERVKARRGYCVKNFHSKTEMRAWVPRVRAVHRQAFAGSHTFYPPTEREMDAIADSIINIADPRLIKLIMKGEEMIGFIFAYHDISAALQKSKGRLLPLGWWHILQERKRAEWVNVNGVGMLPGYQGLGGNALLYTEVAKSIHEFNFKHAEVVLVDEHNFNSFSDMEAIGVRWYKRHRNYQRTL